VVFLNPLAADAPKTELAAMKLAVNEVQVHGQARRQAGDPGHQGLAVRFPRSYKSQHGAISALRARKRKRGILPDANRHVKLRSVLSATMAA
jgi:hypothetical protein